MSYHSCNSCGYSGGCGSSGLEGVVGSYNTIKGYNSNPASSYGTGDISYMISEAIPFSGDRTGFYGSSGSKQESYSNNHKSRSVTATYTHVTENFLALDRPGSVFIGSANEIKEFVEEAFFAVTGREFPDDIIVRILSKEEFRKSNASLCEKFNDGVQGFAINRKRLGLHSEIFVRQGELDKIMLTIGHELGHVLTRQLQNKTDEEAKAFAFSIAWMKKIKELNIANLSTAIQLDKPAQNGLHDVALDFVLSLINKGEDVFNIYLDLVREFLRAE